MKKTYGGPVFNGNLELEKTGALASTPFEIGRWAAAFASDLKDKSALQNNKSL